MILLKVENHYDLGDLVLERKQTADGKEEGWVEREKMGDRCLSLVIRIQAQNEQDKNIQGTVRKNRIYVKQVTICQPTHLDSDFRLIHDILAPDKEQFILKFEC